MAKRRNIFGEMASKLREVLTPWTLNPTMDNSYALKTEKMNYKITKELYYNTLDAYKLGAGFAKPIINTTVGFCGLPAIVAKDETAQEVIDSYISKWASLLLIAERNSFRDGDSYIRFLRLKNDKLLYVGEETAIQGFLISPEYVTIVPDPITAEEEKYIIKTPIAYKDEAGYQFDFTVVETITAQQRTISYVGRSVPPDLKDEVTENEWGFIPIVHFKNSAEPNELYGRSDLEVVEPFMKAYHDVFLQAMQGSKLHSNPKVKLKLESVENFLKNNFTETQIKSAKETGKLEFNKDIYLMNLSEDMQYMEVQSASGDAQKLLELLFYCIIDASQVPEFAFGTAVQSSKASVSEQLVPLEKKVTMKRTELEIFYQRLVRILLAMVSKAEAQSFLTYEASFDWEDVSPADEEKSANILNLTTQALGLALDHMIISQEAATDFLATLVPSMHKFLSEDKDVIAEKERILTGQALIERLQAGLAGTEVEKEALNKNG